MFGFRQFALSMQNLEAYRFRKRAARVKRNVRGTRRMPRGEKRRKGAGPVADPGYRKFKTLRRRGRGPAIQRRYLRMLP